MIQAADLKRGDALFSTISGKSLVVDSVTSTTLTAVFVDGASVTLSHALVDERLRDGRWYTKGGRNDATEDAAH